MGDVVDDGLSAIKRVGKDLVAEAKTGFYLGTGNVDKAFSNFTDTFAGQILTGGADLVTGTSKKIKNQNRLAKEAADRARIDAANQAALANSQAESGRVLLGRRGRRRSRAEVANSLSSLNVSPSTGIQR